MTEKLLESFKGPYQSPTGEKDYRFTALEYPKEHLSDEFPIKHNSDGVVKCFFDYCNEPLHKSKKGVLLESCKKHTNLFMKIKYGFDECIYDGCNKNQMYSKKGFVLDTCNDHREWLFDTKINVEKKRMTNEQLIKIVEDATGDFKIEHDNEMGDFRFKRVGHNIYFEINRKTILYWKELDRDKYKNIYYPLELRHEWMYKIIPAIKEYYGTNE